MSENAFKACLYLAAISFSIIFCFVVIPAFIDSPDVAGAFAAGFVNPFAAGYSADVFFCWFILAVWVWFEASHRAVKHGWLCLILAVVPGVAFGFALYLLLRQSQLEATK